MFHLDGGQVLRAETLDQLAWLEHGFGTRLTSNWPEPSRLAFLRQVHSKRVVVADRPGDLGEGDALISNTPGLTLAVRTADCLPVLIADPRNHAVAAVHAGWRGAALEIVPEAIQAMTAHFGTRAADLVIAIGPGIGVCCYEVGPEVAARFTAFFPDLASVEGASKLDLAETIIRQLRRNGGSAGQIASSALCTSCNGTLCHSYRRDGQAAGRMVSTIGVR